MHEIVFVRSLVNIWPPILLSFAFDQGKNMQITKFWQLFLRGACCRCPTRPTIWRWRGSTLRRRRRCTHRTAVHYLPAGSTRVPSAGDA